MKDYYKILGVKPTASPEETHARWIELMRKYHPDRGIEQGPEVERVREINEAYGVLKDSTSRGQYDLKRAYQRKKRRLYLQRIVTPPAIVIILLILGLIYLQRSRGALPAKSRLPSLRTSIRIEPNPPFPREHRINPTHQTDEIDDIDQMDQIDERDQINQTNQSTPDPTSGLKERKASPLFAKAKASVKGNNAAPLANQPSHAKKFSTFNQRNQMNEIDQRHEMDQKHQIDEMNQTNEIDQRDQINQIIVQFKEGSSVVTEKEVKQFLEDYRERYTRKDIDGFMSLFSAQAVQNGRDGFNEIKKMYSDSFEQSQELQYYLEDVKIDIYQDALVSGIFHKHTVLVDARYRVNQVLKEDKRRVWEGDIRWVLLRENGVLKILYLDYKQRKSR